MQLTLRQFDLERVRGLIGEAGAWWLGEFLNLFPARFASYLRGRSRPTVVVGRSGEILYVQLRAAGVEDDETAGVAQGNVPALVDAFLSRHGLGRHDVEIGLRLPEELVFARDLMLPVEARPSIDAILAQDLARKTPFRADDIYCDHVIDEGMADGRISIQQWIVRRQSVQQAATDLGLQLAEFKFVTFGDHEPAPLIRLSRDAGARQLWQTVLFVLCCSAVVLTILSAYVKYANQQTTLDRLEADIAVASRKAQQVRLMVDQVQERRDALVRLRLQRSEAPGLIDLWEEATRILPQHSWLTELRLVEGAGGREAQVIMSGFSGAAPSLVSIVDGSGLFFDATLTSPVAFDANEGRERFSLQAKVRSTASLKEAAR